MWNILTVRISENKVLLLNGINSYVDLQTPFDYEVMTVSLWFYAQ